MKKFLAFLCCFALLSCSDDSGKSQSAQQNFDDFSGVSFDVDKSYSACNVNSKVVCAINEYIACSINPNRLYCKENKSFLPSFVFMNDENLLRPTFHHYQIAKMKIRPDGLLEVYSLSQCDGNWFGLCQGNIIFVLQNINDNWGVIDAYARESF